MTKPANVIVLDEPTNDLDSETLELLEDQLVEFRGTLLIVSHDRTFLNNVVTSTLVFEDGQVNEYVGGYDDWQAALRRRQEQNAAPVAKQAKGKSSTKNGASAQTAADRRKLSYKDQRELDQLPQQIEKLEAAIEEFHRAMGEPAYYQQSGEKIAAEAAKLADLEESLAKAYARWEELEAS